MLSRPQRNAASGYVCMKFRYHMSGSQGGSLRVFSKQFLANHESELWVKSGNQGRSWKSAKVTIPASRPFEVQIIIFILSICLLLSSIPNGTNAGGFSLNQKTN